MRFVLAFLTACLLADVAQAGDARRFAAIENLRAGMPFTEAQRRLLLRGGHATRLILPQDSRRQALQRVGPHPGIRMREPTREVLGEGGM